MMCSDSCGVCVVFQFVSTVDKLMSEACGRKGRIMSSGCSIARQWWSTSFDTRNKSLDWCTWLTLIKSYSQICYEAMKSTRQINTNHKVSAQAFTYVSPPSVLACCRVWRPVEKHNLATWLGMRQHETTKGRLHPDKGEKATWQLRWHHDNSGYMYCMGFPHSEGQDFLGEKKF